MNTTIDMESRECRNCGRPYRVMTKSAQKVCSTACEELGTRAPGERKNPFNARERQIASVSVYSGPPTRPNEPLNAFIASALGKRGPPKKDKKFLKKEGNTMHSTETNETPSASNGADKTRNVSFVSSGNGTSETEAKPPPRRSSEEIAVIQRESSDELQTNLEREGLTSVQLLKRSSNRLMRLMEECVPDSDLEKASDGVAKIELHRIQTAINCADSITSIVNTQVQMLKVLGGFRKAER